MMVVKDITVNGHQRKKRSDYMKIYYAHFMGIYNTSQEPRDIETIKKLFPRAEVVNPNCKESEIGYKLCGMSYFTEIVQGCDVLVFRGLPYSKIPHGVFTEIECAAKCSITIIELPCFTGRKMDIEDTRSYLKEIGFR